MIVNGIPGYSIYYLFSMNSRDNYNSRFRIQPSQYVQASEGTLYIDIDR